MSYKIGLYLLAGSALMMQAQTPGSSIPAPVPTGQVIYRHWPEQFMQWVGPELPYSMIELYVDSISAPQPIYDAVLTERASGKRIHYSPQPWLVQLNKSTGSDAYLSAMQLDRPANPGANTSYTLRFSEHDGKPVLWQFVQGSDITELGGGVSPAGVQPPVIMYRERSAVAGQGTALKIGNVVSAADVWKEIAQPPYFVPYRGALTANLEIAVFAGEGEQWITLAAPSKLESGAAWKLKTAEGHERTLTVVAVNGDTVTVKEEDAQLAGESVTFDAQLAGSHWSVKKFHYAPTGNSTSKGLTLAFTTGTTDAGQSKFELFSGTKTRLASGIVSVDSQDKTAWQFRTPEWLKSKGSNKAAASNNTGVVASR